MVGNLVENRAIGEVFGVRLLPPAENVIDRKKRELRKARLITLGDGFESRAVVMPCRDLLPFLRIEKLQISKSYVFGAVFARKLVDDGDRRFGQNAE